MAKPKEAVVKLVGRFGEMWARNDKNIKDVPGSSEGGLGVYILYDGSTPVYIGKGRIRSRLRDANGSDRRGNAWDHFSWYVLAEKSLIHDVEVLMIRMLPPHLRRLTRQTGHFKGVHSTDQKRANRTAKYIDRVRLMKTGK
jgi:hypothetical protein